MADIEEEKRDFKKKKKSPVREWFDSVLFAVVAATLIRWLLLEAYVIPSGSMEKTLLVNDFLFVSKMHYGTRTPKTILQLPLTHQKIWFTEIPSFLDWIQLPGYRFPGFSAVKNGDIVVFNYPGCPERPDEFGGYDKYPLDLRTYLIKRCIGIPGDVVELRRATVFVNDAQVPDPPGVQNWYRLESSESINPRLFKRTGAEERGLGAASGLYYYDLTATPDAVRELKKHSFVRNIHQDILTPGDHLTPYKAFPYNDSLNWNRDNIGPLTVPKRGMTIRLDHKNLALYKGLITTFEHHEQAEYRDGRIYLNGKPVEEYTFRQDYYFMMGDNRNDSDDSRFWGFVPADHVVGKALFIWMSLDKDAGLLEKVRWNRLFSRIK